MRRSSRNEQRRYEHGGTGDDERGRTADGRAAVLFAAAVLATLAACGGGQARYTDATGEPRSFLEDSYPAEFRGADVVLAGATIARGDSLFRGVTGRANCYMCHGQLLTGFSDGTNLRDTVWHNSDGSYAAIVATILAGVSKPDHVDMPPRGGMPVSDEQVRAIAAYVYYASRTKVPLQESARDSAAGPSR